MTDSRSPLVEVRGLAKHFPIRRGLLRRETGRVRAVDGVSFSIARGETLGLVGESGCGKSTTGRVILRLIEPSAGSVLFAGADLTAMSRRQLRAQRRAMQMVFQDPYASLNPRATVRRIVREPLDIHGIGAPADRVDRVLDLMEMVGLDPSLAGRHPHEFSGGQQQRVGIARALATDPEFLVADEPIAALDTSIQAQVVNLLVDLKERLRLTVLFIAHDLAMVRYISDRIAVMYLGRIVEVAPSHELFGRPLHPYTKALLSAIPDPDPARARERRPLVRGDVPDPAAAPSGCAFHPRCASAIERCRREAPTLREVGEGGIARQVACHLVD